MRCFLEMRNLAPPSRPCHGRRRACSHRIPGASASLDVLAQALFRFQLSCLCGHETGRNKNALDQRQQNRQVQIVRTIVSYQSVRETYDDELLDIMPYHLQPK